jgi:hypothetical protein
VNSRNGALECLELLHKSGFHHGVLSCVLVLLQRFYLESSLVAGAGRAATLTGRCLGEIENDHLATARSKIAYGYISIVEAFFDEKCEYRMKEDMSQTTGKVTNRYTAMPTNPGATARYDC